MALGDAGGYHAGRYGPTTAPPEPRRVNPVEDLIRLLHDLAADVPDLLLPVLVALAGTVPFVEGEVSSIIGILAGLDPVVAALAGAAGNLASVLVVVLFGSRIRAAVAARRARRVPVGVGAVGGDGPAERPEPSGRRRFRRLLVRYGVPGASLLVPLALPTQFTAAALVASGVGRGWVLLWQGIAILLWTALAAASAAGVLALMT